MTAKPGKDKKDTTRKSLPTDSAAESSASAKNKKSSEDEDDEDLGDDVKDADKKSSLKKPSASTKKKKENEDDDEGDAEEIEDTWDKGEEEDINWDPDFDEFDIPKSKGTKKAGTTDKKGGEEDDFKVDEDFKEFELFNDTVFDDDEDDDF